MNYAIKVHHRHWSIVCLDNNEVIAHSEQYATRWNNRRAAKRLADTTGLPIMTATSVLP